MQNYEYEKEVIGDHPEVVLWTDLPFNEWCPGNVSSSPLIGHWAPLLGSYWLTSPLCCNPATLCSGILVTFSWQVTSTEKWMSPSLFRKQTCFNFSIDVRWQSLNDWQIWLRWYPLSLGHCNQSRVLCVWWWACSGHLDSIIPIHDDDSDFRIFFLRFKS